MFKSPLSQFDVVSVITIFLRNYEVSITNLSISVILVLFVGYLIFNVFFVGHLVPRAWQRILENVFIFVYRLVFQQLGSKGLIYFPFIFTLFLFILSLNLFSLLFSGYRENYLGFEGVWLFYIIWMIHEYANLLYVIKHKS